MNEKQYREICDVCDQILKAPDSTIERVAISWLHVVREHPVFLQKYAGLFNIEGNFFGSLMKLKSIMRNWISWIRQIFRTIHARATPWYESHKISSNVDVLFVSHLLNSTHAGRSSDFYFGDIPKYLVEKKLSVVTALINHSGSNAETHAKKWEKDNVPRIVLSRALRFLEEIALYMRLKKESLRLKRTAKKESEGIIKHVMHMASSEALSGGSHANLRVAIQIGMLVKKIRPKTIVITHEGHAWERVVLAEARRILPNIKCIAYQHAALFQKQHAIRRKLQKEYNPDLILTAGNISARQLRETRDLKEIPIEVLGSNRSYINDIQDDGNSDKSLQNILNKPSCIVLPEGIVSECHLLFDFSLQCAKILPGIQFIWRLHPVISFNTLLKKNSKLRNLPQNIVLSKNTFSEDIPKCQFALYRGSTAIIQAVCAGLRPIYLRLDEEMTIDPLYEIGEWRFIVNNIQELKRVVHEYEHSDIIENTRSRTETIEYCRNFFLPFDIKKMMQALD